VAAALAPGGHFVLDYLNAEQVRRTLKLTEQAKAASTRATRTHGANRS